MLQHLADGRVDLMMGRGNTGPVYPWFGQDIRNGIPLAVRALRAPPPPVARGRRRLGGQAPDAADRASPRRPGRSTACRRSSGTARSAARRSPSRPPTTATASSTTTSSGRRTTSSGWSSSTAAAWSTTATGRPTQAIVGLGGHVFMRENSPGRDPRVPAVLRPRAGLRRRAVARGLHGPDADDDRQPAAGHRPDARRSARSSATTSASCSSPTTPGCRSRPSSSRWTSSASRSCPSSDRSSRRAGPSHVPDAPLHPRVAARRGRRPRPAPRPRPAVTADDRRACRLPDPLARRRQRGARPAVVDRLLGRPPRGRHGASSARRRHRAADPRSSSCASTPRTSTNHLLTGFPSPKLQAVIDAVLGADGLIAVSPIFSASYSGLFKLFFDVVERDGLAGKPALIAATGGTARHSLAIEHALRPLFAYLNAAVVATGVYAAAEDWGAAASLPTAASSSGSTGRPASWRRRWHPASRRGGPIPSPIPSRSRTSCARRIRERRARRRRNRSEVATAGESLDHSRACQLIDREPTPTRRLERPDRSLRDLEAVAALPATRLQVADRGREVRDAVDEDRPVAFEVPREDRRGGPLVSSTIATRVPIASIANTRRPPSTSVRCATSLATSRLGR